MRVTLSAVLATLALTGVSVMPAGAAPPPDRPEVTDRAGPADSRAALLEGGDRRLFGDDMVGPAARSGTAARIRKWPGKVIPYYESIPKKWDWSLDQAFAHWNDSGSKITFVEVPRRKAKLVISYGDTGGADGVGTLGFQARNYIHLSPAYKKADALDAETRVWVGRLFTHELGHVLGFGHTAGRCSLMYPVYDFGVCPPLPLEDPGYYNCRWIDKKLLKRFTQMYGGRPKRPPKLCLIEPLPPELQGVAFSGGNTQNKPVRITWRPPASVRDGTKVHVTVWRGTSCGKPPDTFERRVGVDPKAGTWSDPAFGSGTWCYLVQIENRYGATRPPTGRALARYAPVPAAPSVGTPTWQPDDGSWLFAWSPPNGSTELQAMRDEGSPATCPPTYDEDEAEWLGRSPSGGWVLWANHATECVSLFAVTSWGTVSARTQVVTQIPKPTATPKVGTVGPYAWDESAASTTVVLPASTRYQLGIEVVAGACPAGTVTPPAGSAWADGYPDGDDPQRWYFYPEPWGDTGPQCAMFAAIDWFGQHGPVVGKTFTVAP